MQLKNNNSFKNYQIIIFLVAFVCLIIFGWKVFRYRRNYIEVPTQTKTEICDNYAQDNLALNAKAAIIYDLKSGQIMYAKNIKQKLPVASMSKLLTVYLTLKAINAGKISWQTKVMPSREAIAVSKNPEYSNVPLQLGHQYTIRQLYQATLIQSANGAAMVLASAVAGSSKKFVGMMRKQLLDWHISQAQIVTPSGLPNFTLGRDADSTKNADAENELSAGDMGILIKHLLLEFPQVLDTTRISKLNFPDGRNTFKMVNWNLMLKGLSQYNEAYPVDGLKTGTTDAAGACLASTLVKNGRRIVTVIIGARHLNGNDPARFVETKKLYAYFYNNYSLHIYKRWTQFPGKTLIKVKSSSINEVRACLYQDTGIWISKGQKLDAELSMNKMPMPIKVGTNIGKLIFPNIPALNNENALAFDATTSKELK